MGFLIYLLIGLIITLYTIIVLNKNNITLDILISYINDPKLEKIILDHPLWVKSMLCFIFILEVLLWPIVALLWFIATWHYNIIINSMDSQFNQNDWQGRNKHQVENNYKLLYLSSFLFTVTILILLFCKLLGIPV